MIKINRLLLYLFSLLVLWSIPAFAELTQGYVGSHWQTNPTRHEIVNLIFKGAERKIISIGGFGDNFDLEFHPRKNYGWATNHTVFGSLVKILPAQKDIRPVSGYQQPIDLGLSLADQSLWVLEGKTSEVVRIDSNGNVLIRFGNLPKPHALDVSPKDSSAWIACENDLIKVSKTGEKIAQVKISSPVLSISSDWRDGGCWVAISEENQVIKFSAEGNQMFQVPFENLKEISSSPASGGCWVVDGDKIMQVTADGKKSDVVLGYEGITSISRNLSDGSFWITDQGGDRLSKVPEDENEAVLAVIGLKNRTDNNLQAARHTAIRLVRGGLTVVPETEAETPEPKVEKVETPSVEVSSPPAPPTVQEEPEEKEPLPEKESEEQKAQGNISVEDEEDESRQISEIDAPPEKQISRIPPRPQLPEKEFAGIVFIELSSGLSQKRLKNTASVLGRRYVWNFDGETYTLLLGLDVETYNTYANKDRLSLEEIVLSEVSITETISAEFHKFATAKGWNGEKLVSFVLSFVQCLPYTVDEVTTGYDEWITYAYETLVAGGGDCEDTTILATSILIGLGYDVVLLNPPGHLAFGVEGNYGGSYIEHEGKRYFYCESTGTGWRVGQVPDPYQGTNFRVISISDKK